MDKQAILKTLEKVKTGSPARKFTQTIDLIVNLRDINIKRAEEQVDIYTDLPYSRDKPVKICGLVDKQLLEAAKTHFDLAIDKEEFDKYTDKSFRKIAAQYDYFVAQVTIMPLVAKTFGKVLGKKGKVPNPKAGCVVPPTADLKAVRAKLQKQVHLKAKIEPSIKCAIGDEKMDAEKVAENAFQVYNRLKTALPREENNIKDVRLKVTMGPAVKVDKA